MLSSTQANIHSICSQGNGVEGNHYTTQLNTIMYSQVQVILLCVCSTISTVLSDYLYT